MKLDEAIAAIRKIKADVEAATKIPSQLNRTALLEDLAKLDTLVAYLETHRSCRST